MIINQMQKSIIWIIIAFAVLLAGCQVDFQNYSDISQFFNSETFQNILDEINFQTTTLVTDLGNFIQLYRFENLPVLENKPEPVNTETLITFQVQVPDNTPKDDMVFLSILDEVTGLALNSEHYKMEELPVSTQMETSDTSRYYSVSLPMKIGSVVKI